MKVKELLREHRVFATGKNGTPGKCFQNVTAPTLPFDTVIGYGTVSDGKETVPHVFLLDKNGDIHEPTKMKGQTSFNKGDEITHLKYSVVGKILLKDLPSTGKDGLEQWKSRELSLAKLVQDKVPS